MLKKFALALSSGGARGPMDPKCGFGMHEECTKVKGYWACNCVVTK